nr:hypothetical protein [Paracoccus versutus]
MMVVVMMTRTVRRMIVPGPRADRRGIRRKGYARETDMRGVDIVRQQRACGQFGGLGHGNDDFAAPQLTGGVAISKGMPDPERRQNIGFGQGDDHHLFRQAGHGQDTGPVIVQNRAIRQPAWLLQVDADIGARFAGPAKPAPARIGGGDPYPVPPPVAKTRFIGMTQDFTNDQHDLSFIF